LEPGEVISNQWLEPCGAAVLDRIQPRKKETANEHEKTLGPRLYGGGNGGSGGLAGTAAVDSTGGGGGGCGSSGAGGKGGSGIVIVRYPYAGPPGTVISLF
jgi:hypothetical protein